jgi:1-acyl-sn-glycerol-3-phosphate acyltransferase
MVLIFPEGTRSEDGEIQPLKPGFVALARRSRTPLLPVAVDGAYEAWPRKALLPRPATIHVCFGEPMSVDHIHSLTDEELIAEVEARIRACQALARQGRRA